MGKVTKQALKFYQKNLRVWSTPVKDRDEYDMTFWLGHHKIGTVRMDGLELACMSDGCFDHTFDWQGVLTYRPGLDEEIKEGKVRAELGEPWE